MYKAGINIAECRQRPFNPIHTVYYTPTTGEGAGSSQRYQSLRDTKNITQMVGSYTICVLQLRKPSYENGVMVSPTNMPLST